MADLEHGHFAALVTHKIDNSIIALPHTVLVLARQLLTAGRPWICNQTFDAPNDTPAIFPRNCFKFLDGGRLDKELIDVHAASGP